MINGVTEKLRADAQSFAKLFKYLEPRWADQMVDQGSVRIGTLFDFRHKEAHGKERGDELEGVRVTMTDGRAGTFAGEEIPAFLKDSLRIPEGVAIQFAEGAVLRQHASVPDMYVYCTCHQFSEALLTRFGGACVEIHQPEKFFAAITGTLAEWDEYGVRRARGFSLAACEYRDREQTWPRASRYNPVFRKPRRYQHQAEVRAAWRPLARRIRPLDLTVPSITDWCRRRQ